MSAVDSHILSLRARTSWASTPQIPTTQSSCTTRTMSLLVHSRVVVLEHIRLLSNLEAPISLPNGERYVQVSLPIHVPCEKCYMLIPFYILLAWAGCRRTLSCRPCSASKRLFCIYWTRTQYCTQVEFTGIDHILRLAAFNNVITIVCHSCSRR